MRPRLHNLPAVAEERPERILALEEALEWLEHHDEALAAIISHHYFTGLSVAETAAFSGSSDRTVKRRLAEGRILLHRKIIAVLSEWS